MSKLDFIRGVIRPVLVIMFAIAFLTFVCIAVLRFLDREIAVGLIGSFTTLAVGVLSYWLGSRTKESK